MSLASELIRKTKSIEVDGVNLTLKKLPVMVVIELAEKEDIIIDTDNATPEQTKVVIERMALILSKGVVEFEEEYDVLLEMSQDQLEFFAEVTKQVQEFSGLIAEEADGEEE